MTDRKTDLLSIDIQLVWEMVPVAVAAWGEAQGDANRWPGARAVVKAGRQTKRWISALKMVSEFGFMRTYSLGFLKGRKTGPVALCRSLCHTV